MAVVTQRHRVGPLRALRHRIETSDHARFPVVQGSLDNVQGVVNARQWQSRATRDGGRALRDQPTLKRRVGTYARLAQALKITLPGAGIVQAGQECQVALVAAQQDLAQANQAVD